MFDPKRFRDKAAEYSELGKTATAPGEAFEFGVIEKGFTTLADNEQWLSDNHRQTVRRDGGPELAEEEEHVLRCLGAALIMQWATLPKKLQRELFDNAGAMGDIVNAASLRGQIARFLHKHSG